MADLLSDGYEGSHHAFDVEVQRDVLVPTRAGIQLATDIYFPATAMGPAPGRFPALVERTPYDKDAARFVRHARFFAQHGRTIRPTGQYHSGRQHDLS